MKLVRAHFDTILVSLTEKDSEKIAYQLYAVLFIFVSVFNEQWKLCTSS